MAEINQEILKRTLVINVEDGTGADGTTKYKAKNFSNARLARNLYERVWAKASVRHQLNRGEPIRLLPEDLRSAVADKEFQQLLHAKGTSIGFTAVLDAPK